MPPDHERFYYVYILGSISGTLSIGITRSPRRRIWQHKHHSIEGFIAEYDVTRLFSFEPFREIGQAIGPSSN